jgi:hypothetical protein
MVCSRLDPFYHVILDIQITVLSYIRTLNDISYSLPKPPSDPYFDYSKIQCYCFRNITKIQIFRCRYRLTANVELARRSSTKLSALLIALPQFNHKHIRQSRPHYCQLLLEITLAYKNTPPSTLQSWARCQSLGGRQTMARQQPRWSSPPKWCGGDIRRGGDGTRTVQ